MRAWFPVMIACLLFPFCASSQYYFKDIVLTRQNQENWKQLRAEKIRAVDIQSIDANNEPTPGFICTQNLTADFSTIATYTKSADIAASTLTAFYSNDGKMLRTVDTSDTYKSTTEYTYNDKGDISTMTNTSVQTDNQVSATEKHIWSYQDGSPSQMIKIKNGTDTTLVKLIRDAKGNISEEKSSRGGQSMQSVYYYYDDQKRLTDIVRYNQRAGRMLPDYIFTYSADHLASMLFVPTGSNDYQKWVYSYNPAGLKSTEICYDKQKKPIVKINYSYSSH